MNLDRSGGSSIREASRQHDETRKETDVQRWLNGEMVNTASTLPSEKPDHKDTQAGQGGRSATYSSSPPPSQRRAGDLPTSPTLQPKFRVRGSPGSHKSSVDAQAGTTDWPSPQSSATTMQNNSIRFRAVAAGGEAEGSKASDGQHQLDENEFDDARSGFGLGTHDGGAAEMTPLEKMQALKQAGASMFADLGKADKSIRARQKARGALVMQLQQLQRAVQMAENDLRERLAECDKINAEERSKCAELEQQLHNCRSCFTGVRSELESDLRERCSENRMNLDQQRGDHFKLRVLVNELKRSLYPPPSSHWVWFRMILWVLSTVATPFRLLIRLLFSKEFLVSRQRKTPQSANPSQPAKYDKRHTTMSEFASQGARRSLKVEEEIGEDFEDAEDFCND